MCKLICCLAVALAGVGGQAVAAIINVPANQPTIQAGIDAAVNGDEVVVAVGTYNEAIDFMGKAITVRSTDPLDPAVVAATIIDGTGFFHVVRCVSDEGPDTVLAGFVITGGNANSPFFPNNIGGGMYNASSPTVTNCTFSGNTASGSGGGMYNHDGSSPTVTNCTFSGNTAGAGGGMANWINSSPTVTNCTFSGNTATIGGGMDNFPGSSPTVTGCIFSGNTAEVGGGMCNPGDSDPTVTNCTFSGNTGVIGGGMFNGTVFGPTVTNCTFSGNTGTFGGGGMYNASSPTVTNCTFSGNTAPLGPGGGMFNGSSPTVTNCILWGNSPDEIVDVGNALTTVSYSDVQGGFLGLGNIDADPLFIDADGPDNIPGTEDDNPRLMFGSPAIDAGHNYAIAGITDTDLDGNPRFADDPATPDTGCGVPVIVDMGAYEFQGTPGTVKLGDIDGDGVVGWSDLKALIATWRSTAPGCELADLDLDGIVAVPDLLTLLANWG